MLKWSDFQLSKHGKKVNAMKILDVFSWGFNVCSYL